MAHMCAAHTPYAEKLAPLAQDAANANGGKWMIRLRKGLASRLWENLVRRPGPA